MSTESPNGEHDGRARTVEAIGELLEYLRIQIVDVEATAHCAEEVMSSLPYLPRLPSRPRAESPEGADAAAIRLRFGRLQTLVIATAKGALTLLEELEEGLRRVHESDDDSGSGGGRGPGGNHAGGGNGHAGLLPAGTMPHTN